jgi:hypothetical protein
MLNHFTEKNLRRLTNEGVALTNIYYSPYTNVVCIAQATNVAGYWTKGTHGTVTNYTFPVDQEVVFSGNSSWYIMTTIESFNGQRYWNNQSQSSFVMWFAPDAFGGTDYSNTPVGSVSHVDEPRSWIDLQTYYGLWAAGKNFAICAWNARQAATTQEAQKFQAVGDPFVIQ